MPEKMILYHGSQYITEHPVYHGGKPHNDYGYGFYTTEDHNLACEWAVRVDHDGYVNKYELNAEGLCVLNLDKAPYYALHWLEVLIENRTFSLKSTLAVEASQYLRKYYSVPYQEADLIIGYRADDSYFRFAADFLNGTISYGQLCRSLRLGQLGEADRCPKPVGNRQAELHRVRTRIQAGLVSEERSPGAEGKEGIL